jgi:hypothetical protein
MSCVVAAATSGSARAAPAYSQALDDATRARVRAELVKSASAEGIAADVIERAVDRLLASKVIATTTDTRCPGVEVDVVNATDHTVWNVELTIRQRTDVDTQEDVFHLPYLVKQSIVHAYVACALAHSAIRIAYAAEAARDLRQAMRGLRDTKVDYGRAGWSAPGGGPVIVTKRSLEGLPRELGGTDLVLRVPSRDHPAEPAEPAVPGRTLLAETLANQDAEVADELVRGIATSALGVGELGDALAHDATGPIAAVVAAILGSSSPAAQSTLARVVLALPSAGRWTSQLLPIIDGPLCRGGRAAAVELWLQAQGDHAMPVAALRDRVRERCALHDDDDQFVAALLLRAPARTGEVLDAIEPRLFGAVIAAWKATTAGHATALVAYLREGNDPARFDRAVATLSNAGLSGALAEVAKARPGPATQRKAAWITANLDEAGDLEATVRALTRELVDGEIVAEPMHAAVAEARARSPAAAQAGVTAYARLHPSMFDLEKLGTGIDAGELLGFATTALARCPTSVAALRACAKAIAAYQGGALARVAGAAVRPQFLAELRGVVGQEHDPQQLTALAGELRAAGLPVELVVDRACQAAQFESDADAWLAAAESVAPGAACVARVRAERASHRRRMFWLALFVVLGLVAPLPFGALALHLCHRSLQHQLPAIAADDKPGAEQLGDRLGERGLGRGLRAGVAQAARELADSPAGRAAEAVDSSILEAAASVVGRAVKSGDAASVIVRRASDAVYVVGLPVAHPRPQTSQRYLGAPWPAHLAAIQRATGSPVLALVVLCGPAAAEASLLVGFAPGPGDAQPASDPEVLLDARVARERGANRFHYAMTLSVAASNEV